MKGGLHDCLKNAPPHLLFPFESYNAREEKSPGAAHRPLAGGQRPEPREAESPARDAGGAREGATLLALRTPPFDPIFLHNAINSFLILKYILQNLLQF